MMIYFLLSLEAAIAYLLLLRSGAAKNNQAKLISCVFILIAFVARALCLPHVSADYRIFLSGWMDSIRANGGLHSLAGQIGNYTLPYLTILSLFSYTSVGDLYLIKLLSIFFDIVLAWSVMKIVEKLTGDGRKMLIAFFAVLLWPTVIINSAFWGQCDSIYVAMGILGIYLALDDRPVLSMICIAVSFGFKLQAVFIMPVYAVLWMNGKFRWWHFLLFPLTYVVLLLPAVFAGRPFMDALLLYTTQTESIGIGYSYTAPSFLSIVQAGQTALASLNTPEGIAKVSKVFVIIAFVFVLAVLAFCFIKRMKLDDFRILLTAALLAICIPYLLPHMHERYFFFADAMMLLLALIDRKFLPFAVISELCSLFTYRAYYSSIINTPYIPVFLIAIIVGAEIIWYLVKYFKFLNE